MGGLRSCTAGVCLSMSTATTGAAVTGAIEGADVTGADDGGDDWRGSSPGMKHSNGQYIFGKAPLSPGTEKVQLLGAAPFTMALRELRSDEFKEACRISHEISSDQGPPGMLAL